MGELYQRAYKISALEQAWRLVKERGLQSGSRKVRADTKSFDAAGSRSLKSIQSKLVHGTFAFEPAKGVAISRGPAKKHRPIVVATVASRIVQRSIHDVLVEAVPAVAAIRDIPTSVGGIAGVADAVRLVFDGIAQGATWAIRSDIPDFFTKIPRDKVVGFLRSEVADKKFLDLFEAALTTTLQNQDELGPLAKLFPLGDIGVAQGSALSPLVGNIVLAEFDRVMNDGEVLCIRYIDDFLILAPNKAKASAAFRKARSLLASLKMDAYDPVAHPEKAYSGPVEGGFDFLGCYIKRGLVQPAKSRQLAFIERIKEILSDGLKAMDKAKGGDPGHLLGQRRAQSLVLIDRVSKGWGEAFAFCNGRQIFVALDGKVDQEIELFERRASAALGTASPVEKRRMNGIFALSDITRKDLPPSRLSSKLRMKVCEPLSVG